MRYGIWCRCSSCIVVLTHAACYTLPTTLHYTAWLQCVRRINETQSSYKHTFEDKKDKKKKTKTKKTIRKILKRLRLAARVGTDVPSTGRTYSYIHNMNCCWRRVELLIFSIQLIHTNTVMCIIITRIIVIIIKISGLCSRFIERIENIPTYRHCWLGVAIILMNMHCSDWLGSVLWSIDSWRPTHGEKKL